MIDPMADFLTRIRNASLVKHETVVVPASKKTREVAKILKQKGFIDDFEMRKGGRVIKIDLRYIQGEPAILGSRQESKPGRRVYVDTKHLPKVLGGEGAAIVSTSKGIMTGEQAKRQGLGGEWLCSIW